ncbi:hAT family dimerization protein [Ceratobasidium sp. AG-Ba]|nr:hAT family dimerization protein [Ceratobasidium sp. AG-Ba]
MYRCPVHPNIPPFDLKSYLKPSKGNSGFHSSATGSFPHVGTLGFTQHLSPSTHGNGAQQAHIPTSYDHYKSAPPPPAQNISKRSQSSDVPLPNAKRSRTQQSTFPTNVAQLTPLRQVEMAQLAAASVPPAYHVNDEAEGVKRVQESRALDCWYFFVGAYTRDTPAQQEMADALVADLARTNGSVPLDLRKPSTPFLRCTECLKLNRWRTWKNNHNGGLASHLRPHLEKEHYVAYLAACERIGYTPDSKVHAKRDSDDVHEPLTAEGILKYITEWFAEDDISFNMVSHRGFRRFFSYIGQGKVTTADIPDRHAIAAKVQKLSAEAMEKIKREIKLGMITLDNASNNDTLMAQLEEYMLNHGLEFDRDGNRLRCFPHVINLAVLAILAALSESAKVFRRLLSNSSDTMDVQQELYLLALESEPQNRIRRTAVALRRAQHRQGLRNTIREGNEQRIWRTHRLVDDSWRLVEFEMKVLELRLDCPTRWSSTRDMIERLLYLYPAVSRYIASDTTLSEYAISHMDYEVLSDISDVLELANRTQQLLSSDKTPTLSLALPLYYALIDQWRNLQIKRPALSHAIGAGIEKLETYLAKTRSSPAHIVAMALNPSIRYDWIDQNWSPMEASNAREVVKRHWLNAVNEAEELVVAKQER